MDRNAFELMLASALAPKPWAEDDLINRHAVMRSFLTPPPEMSLAKAPPLAEYPSSEDASSAKDVGFGYGSGLESFLSGQTMNAFAPEGVPKSGYEYLLTELTDPAMAKPVPGTPESADILTRAALAANRIPLAALGFDPRNLTLDAVSNGAFSNTVGAYRTDSDQMFSFLNREGQTNSTPVHEAIHRGIKMLQSSPNAVEDPDVDEEFLVRYLMETLAGDPENSGEFAIEQKDTARNLFEEAWGAGARRSKLDEMNAAAAREIARRRPGGPR